MPTAFTQLSRAAVSTVLTFDEISVAPPELLRPQAAHSRHPADDITLGARMPRASVPEASLNLHPFWSTWSAAFSRLRLLGPRREPRGDSANKGYAGRLSRQPEGRFVRLPAVPAVFGFCSQTILATVITEMARSCAKATGRIRKPPLYPPELRAQTLWWQMLRNARLKRADNRNDNRLSRQKTCILTLPIGQAHS